jgi:hypothetical protein
MAEKCLSRDCLQQIAEFTEHIDLLSNAQHECKFHPEAKKESCDQFVRMRNEIGKKEKALTKACEMGI